MTGARTVDELLDDIVANGERLQAYIAKITLEEFRRNQMIIDAVERCIERIGEAAGRAIKIEPTLISDYPDFDARTAYAARNVISHAYHLVLADVLWDTVTKSIPEFVAAARRIIAERKAKSP